jgi:hypothetical protein
LLSVDDGDAARRIVALIDVLGVSCLGMICPAHETFRVMRIGRAGAHLTAGLGVS